VEEAMERRKDDKDEREEGKKMKEKKCFWNVLEAWRKWEKNNPISKKNLMSQITKLPFKGKDTIILR
jgi:hypothetical protein